MPEAGSPPPRGAAAPEPSDREESKEYRKALTLIKAGQWEKAREVLEEYIQKNPESVKAQNKYAFVLLEMGKARGAKQVLQTIIARGQRDFYTHFLLGRAFHREGSLRVAIQQYTNALTLKPDDVYTINGLAMALRETGEGAKAVTLLARALTLSREDPTTFIQLADLYMELGDLESAGRWIAQGLQEHPTELKLRCLHAQCLLRAGEVAKSRAAYEQIARDLPSSAEGRIGVARTLVEQGRLQDALKELAAAVAAEPKSTSTYREQARIQTKLGDAAAAVAAMQKAHDLDPKDVRIVAELADALIARKLKLKAYMVLKRAVAMRNDYHYSHHLIGRLYLDEELWSQAKDELIMAYKLNPDFAPTRGLLAEALARLDEAEAAVPHIEALLARDKEDRQARFAKALLDRRGGDAKSAEKTLEALARGADRVAALARLALTSRT
ncbi:MAG: tetratricopeptide repeat protein [Candidatus Wallbacteria bacterium]|nr:tetratricopeptide repeat protein [Candidatus Wallbacteria bacterium]